MKKLLLIAICGVLFGGITVFAGEPEVVYDCLNRTVDVSYQAQESGTITFKMEYVDTNRVCGLFEKVTDAENKATFHITLPQNAPYGDYCITLYDNNSGERYEDRITHREPSSDCEITAFSIKGRQALISGGNITLTLPYGTDRKILVPIFETAGTVYVDTVEQISGESIVDLSRPKTYTVIAEDGTERSYYVTVNVEPAKQSGGSSGGSTGGGSNGLGNVITYIPPAEKPDITQQQPGGEEQDSDTGDQFIDVPVSHWAHSVIMQLKAAGIVDGVDDLYYEPERSITYAEFLKLLVSVANLSDTGVEVASLYGQEDEWYYEYAKKAISHHIQIAEEPFDAPLTREKMAQLLYLTIQVKGITLSQDLDISFLDEDLINDEYREAVEVLSTSDVLRGDGTGNFRPKDSLSRAEAAVVISYLKEEAAK